MKRQTNKKTDERTKHINMFIYYFYFSYFRLWTYLINIQYGSLCGCTNHDFAVVQQLYSDIQQRERTRTLNKEKLYCLYVQPK